MLIDIEGTDITYLNHMKFWPNQIREIVNPETFTEEEIVTCKFLLISFTFKIFIYTLQFCIVSDNPETFNRIFRLTREPQGIIPESVKNMSHDHSIILGRTNPFDPYTAKGYLKVSSITKECPGRNFIKMSVVRKVRQQYGSQWHFVCGKKFKYYATSRHENFIMFSGGVLDVMLFKNN